MALSQTEELLDFVDANDQVIGQKSRSEIYAEKLNFRTVNGFVINSKGELYIPRRTAKQRIFPLCLDFSVAGHVKSGESYEEAFTRKAANELGVDVKDVNVRELGYLSPQDGVSSFMKVYEIHMNETPDYDRAEFSEHFWLTPTALLEKIANGDKAKSDLPLLISKFYNTELNTQI